MAPLYLTMALVIREPSNRPSALKKHGKESENNNTDFVFQYFSYRQSVLFKFHMNIIVCQLVYFS